MAQVQKFINGIMVKAPITCIGAVVLVMIQTPKQAPVMAVIILVVALLVMANMRIGYPRFGMVQKRLDGLNGAAREFILSVRVVKAFHAEQEEEKKFEDVSQALANALCASGLLPCRARLPADRDNSICQFQPISFLNRIPSVTLMLHNEISGESNVVGMILKVMIQIKI